MLRMIPLLESFNAHEYIHFVQVFLFYVIPSVSKLPRAIP